MAMVVSDPKLTDWLDDPSEEHDNGLTPDARRELSSVLAKDDAYEFFAHAILSPSLDLSKDVQIRRSYRSMQILQQDLAMPPEVAVLMNATRAGLLAKDIFAALDNTTTNTNTNSRARPHLIHARQLLDALLEAYPSSVVSAAAAGGQEGMEQHLGPLLLAESASQTLPTFTTLVIYGCTGKMGQASAEQVPPQATNATAAMMMQQQSSSIISHGHQRKFVTCLANWQFMSRLAQCIHDDYVSVGEEVCEAILTIIECVGYPDDPTTNNNNNNNKNKTVLSIAGQESLLQPLGTSSWWKHLMEQLESTSGEAATRVAAARVISGIFSLATGSSSRVRRMDAPMTDATDIVSDTDDNVAAKAVQEQVHEHKNKLLEWGLTQQIHASLIVHLPRICHALFQQHKDKGIDHTTATTYWNRNDDDENKENDVPGRVPHPGRCRIVPFTSWRLQLISLLAELLTYRPATTMATEETESTRHAAMSAIMELPLPLNLQSPKDQQVNDNDNDDVILNPWPALCDWVFGYPENNLYHVQFIRLFSAICMEHHEASLRLVLQKTKFVSRAVGTCKATGGAGPLRGMLLVCLNVLRLASQSLPPSAFLRQFLYSHDAWKDFQPKLQELTLEQQLPFGGKPMPGQEALFVKSMGINLGSTYASDLGFDGVEPFVEQNSGGGAQGHQAEGGGGGKKKKKKRKKKKKAGAEAQAPVDEEQKDGDQSSKIIEDDILI